MLHKTRGIVLKTTDYGDSSVVVQMFTDKFGMQSYLINGVKKPKAKIHMNLLQPLHLVDMVVYHKTNSGIQRVSELRPAVVFRSIPYDIVKSTIIMFLNEVLYKSIRQQHTDEHLFDFIFNGISWFDESGGQNINFHLAFLLKLSRFLGFAPSMETRSDQSFFDLQEGEFSSRVPAHLNFLAQEEARLFIALFQTSFDKVQELQLSNPMRRTLLEKILVFYTLHTASFGDIRSHQVLQEILS
jgi:DNA repair protein RecO (recombination protein O)